MWVKRRKAHMRDHDAPDPTVDSRAKRSEIVAPEFLRAYGDTRCLEV